MGGGLDVQDEEGGGCQDEHHSAPIHGQRGEADERQHQTHHPAHPGQQRAGMEKLDQDREEADGHQQIGDRRIEDLVGDQLERLRVERDDLRPRHMDREWARGGRYRPTVQCVKQ